jgi:hypothetical protein
MSPNVGRRGPFRDDGDPEVRPVVFHRLPFNIGDVHTRNSILPTIPPTWTLTLIDEAAADRSDLLDKESALLCETPDAGVVT